jgi:hypothetical protein
VESGGKEDLTLTPAGDPTEKKIEKDWGVAQVVKYLALSSSMSTAKKQRGKKK